MRRWLLAACYIFSSTSAQIGAQVPSHIYDKQADFSRYKTFTWARFVNATALGELTEGQLTGTLQVALAARGLARAQTNTPDVYVAYEIVSTDPKDARTFELLLPDGSRQAGTLSLGGAAMPMHQGDLVLDFYDATTKQLVWRSVVANPVNLDGKPASRQKQLDRAAQKLMKHYPPG
ncbi:MAG TPA: DUF4136 domain-containing protein [Methylomirabilota bacterium]|nr:DUF4136 domain-containing protein [Methylomirabilota bacterium]